MQYIWIEEPLNEIPILGLRDLLQNCGFNINYNDHQQQTNKKRFLKKDIMLSKNDINRRNIAQMTSIIKPKAITYLPPSLNDVI